VAWFRFADRSCRPSASEQLPPAPPADQCPPLPGNFEVPEDEPSVIRELQAYPPARRTFPVVDWKPETWRQYRWTYNRMTEMVDAQIGEILDALKASGKLDNTVIVFTSDHGDGVGAHKWNQKMVLYEESVRVPFIMVHPGGKKKAVNNSRLINIGIDLAATFMDYAGSPLNSSYHGKSLRPTVKWVKRDNVFYLELQRPE
jgi:arylsulfatase A-like enzyme